MHTFKKSTEKIISDFFALMTSITTDKYNLLTHTSMNVDVLEAIKENIEGSRTEVWSKSYVLAMMNIHFI